jgi:enoyl-CoA hydratase/carnithine racemase
VPATDSQFAHLRLEEPRPQVALLTLDRPERLNALSWALVDELHAALDAVGRDNSLRALVLTGAGRGFCAGLDLTEGIGSSMSAGLDGPAAGMRSQEHIANVMLKIRSIPQPVIAAVNGVAVGGGFALACYSDIRLAAASARFGVQFIKVGLSGCDVGVSYALPRLVGASRAFELMLTGRRFDAAEADRIGFVSRVVPDGTVVDAALDLADEILAHSPFGVVMTKEVMWANLSASSPETAIDLENRTQILASHSGDFVEAVRAFAEKRPPDFGRRTR